MHFGKLHGAPKARATLERPRRRWFAARSAATNEAEQPGSTQKMSDICTRKNSAVNLVFRFFKKAAVVCNTGDQKSNPGKNVYRESNSESLTCIKKESWATPKLQRDLESKAHFH